MPKNYRESDKPHKLQIRRRQMTSPSSFSFLTSKLIEKETSH
ncbi:hypothetical protein PCS8203_01055 [Streptococcus pneumoniae PCS8203]|nr:hypothetical protein PCS8203_01055 [Streptococcus pneumoniae PCS8203]ELU57846.1 hypothetical protein PCS8106_01117 [Streptococcus pneumoniae PCS8106]